jgi:hypothetical protein
VGMTSKLNFGPAFCLGLVTTKAGALAATDGAVSSPINNAAPRDGLPNPLRQNPVEAKDNE